MDPNLLRSANLYDNNSVSRVGRQSNTYTGGAVYDDTASISEDVVEPDHVRLFDANQMRMPWKEALKSNPKSLLWCCYALFTTVLWGYDGLSGTIILAIGNFRQDFGDKFDGQFVVPANWQLIFSAGSLIGFVLGGVATGFVARRWGRQLCLLISYIFMIVGVTLYWLSSGTPGNRILFTIGKLLTGFPLGVFITVAPTYCSEIAPPILRGAVTAAVNWSIVLGQLLTYIVMSATQSLPGLNSYRIVFAVQWGLAGIALVALPFFPESPYHLVSQGRLDKARQNVLKLHGKDFDASGFLASIVVDLDTEIKMKRKASFRECFKGHSRQRTFIAMSTFLVQAFCGISWITGYMAYFLQLGGLSTNTAFNATVGLSALMLVGNMFGWIFVERFGRRGTALWGAIVLAVALIMIGITGSIPAKGAIFAQVGFMAVWAFVYQATIGSVAWPIVTEVSKSSLRGHTQALVTVTNGVAGAVSGVALPYLVNPDAANLGGKTAFIYGGLLALSCGFIWWKWPETKGRSFIEIDTLFEMGIPPRHFSTTRLANNDMEEIPLKGRKRRYVRVDEVSDGP